MAAAAEEKQEQHSRSNREMPWGERDSEIMTLAKLAGLRSTVEKKKDNEITKSLSSVDNTAAPDTASYLGDIAGDVEMKVLHRSHLQQHSEQPKNVTKTETKITNSVQHEVKTLPVAQKRIVIRGNRNKYSSSESSSSSSSSSVSPTRQFNQQSLGDQTRRADSNKNTQSVFPTRKGNLAIQSTESNYNENLGGIITVDVPEFPVRRQRGPQIAANTAGHGKGINLSNKRRVERQRQTTFPRTSSSEDSEDEDKSSSSDSSSIGSTLRDFKQKK